MGCELGYTAVISKIMIEFNWLPNCIVRILVNHAWRQEVQRKNEFHEICIQRFTGASRRILTGPKDLAVVINDDRIRADVFRSAENPLEHLVFSILQIRPGMDDSKGVPGADRNGDALQHGPGNRGRRLD